MQGSAHVLSYFFNTTKMSGMNRSGLLVSLVRCIRRQQRFPFIETLNHRTTQFTVARGRAVHSLTARYLADCKAKHPWTLYQRGLCFEAPHKGDEYPPLPEYIANSEEERRKEARDVFIVHAKGLPWSCTVEDLMSFFCECRIRGGVDGIHLLNNEYGKPLGQAIIELEHVEDIEKALQRHRHYLRDRYVEVSEVTNKDAEALLKAAMPIETDGVVRLGGLPYSSTEKDIIQFFTGLEIVENGVTIVLNKRGRPSGFAYVEFASKEMAKEALKKNKEILGERYIQIFPSKKSAVEHQHRRLQTDIPLKNKTVPKFFIQMRGVPFAAKGVDIVKFFAPLIPLKVLIEYGPDGRPTGEAEAYFTKYQEAVLAMAKDREYIMGRYIELYLNNSYGSSEEQ